MEQYRKAIFRLSIIIFSLSLLILSGCDEDPVSGEGGDYDLDLVRIISNPISPMPGEKTVLSVRTGGYSSGPWPSYHWEVSGGTLLTNGEAVAQWVVPEATGDYKIRLSSSLESESEACSLDVSVRNYERLDTGRDFSIYPNLIGGEIFFVSPYDDRSFIASEYISSNVMRFVGPGSSEGITSRILSFKAGINMGGDYFVFTDNGQYVIASMLTPILYAKLQRKNIAKFGLFGAGDEIVTDQYNETQRVRYDRYNYPYPNEDASMVVMQFREIGDNEAGTEDLFNISFWNEFSGNPVKLTNSVITEPVVSGDDTLGWKDYYFENTKPVFTPDEEYIIYFCDSSGTFEPSMIPVNGGTPDPSAMLVFEIFSNMGIDIPENAILQWEPGGNTMAFIADVNGDNTLCFLDYNPGTLSSSTLNVRTTGIKGVQEFVWSPKNGDGGAVITETGIGLVTPGGEYTPVMDKELQTDMLCGVNFSSPDGEKIGFRIGRQGSAWHEAFSALMVDSLGDDRSPTYVTKKYPWPSDAEISIDDFDFRWRRVVFDSDGSGIYGPVTIGESDPDGDGPNPVNATIEIVHSWK